MSAKKINDGSKKDIPEDLTREINLDDLYDGAVNNTVIIDPVTNDEVLFSSKKTNFTILGIAFAILALLAFYYINNKTRLGATTKDAVPETTTTTTEVVELVERKSGLLSCKFVSHGNLEVQTITYTADYYNDLLTRSTFNYAAVLTSEKESPLLTNLTGEYEEFYLNNASLSGSSVTFEKDDKGFTFNVNTNYETAEFDRIIVQDGKTLSFVKPNLNDRYDFMQEEYEKKGFTCTLTDIKN